MWKNSFNFNNFKFWSIYLFINLFTVGVKNSNSFCTRLQNTNQIREKNLLIDSVPDRLLIDLNPYAMSLFCSISRADSIQWMDNAGDSLSELNNDYRCQWLLATHCCTQLSICIRICVVLFPFFSVGFFLLYCVLRVI